MTTTSGWKPLPPTTRSPSSGPKKVSVKRFMCCPGCAECARRTPTEFISFQEHGTRAPLPDQRAEVSDQGLQPPDPGASTQPLHALLLLHLRSSAWIDGHALSVILALSGHLLSKRPLLYRTGAQESPGRLPQER